TASGAPWVPRRPGGTPRRGGKTLAPRGRAKKLTSLGAWPRLASKASGRSPPPKATGRGREAAKSPGAILGPRSSKKATEPKISAASATNEAIRRRERVWIIRVLQRRM